MSAAVNSIIGAQSDSIGRGAGGSESGEESGSSESRGKQRPSAPAAEAPEAPAASLGKAIGSAQQAGAPDTDRLDAPSSS